MKPFKHNALMGTLYCLVLLLMTVGQAIASNHSSYPIGPKKIGQLYYMSWMWRQTPDAATNHSLSFAVSSNLQDWQSCNGFTQSVPIDYQSNFLVESGTTYIDDQRQYLGLLNSRQDFNVINGTPIITYQMNDDQGTQLFNAIQGKDCKWQKQKITNHCEYMNAHGNGSLNESLKLRFTPVTQQDGAITQQVQSALQSCDGKPTSGLWVYSKDLTLISTIDSEFNGVVVDKAQQKVRMQAQTQHYTFDWLAKVNSRDKSPKCLPQHCMMWDFFSEVMLTHKPTGNVERILQQNGKPLQVWGGSQAEFSAVEHNNALYFAYNSRDFCITLAEIIDNKVSRSVCVMPMNDKWDSHNSVELTTFNGKLWVTGNLHDNPVQIAVITPDTLTQDSMFASAPDTSYTYPMFIEQPNKLLMMIRKGGSGNGEHQVFDITNKQLKPAFTLFKYK